MSISSPVVRERWRERARLRGLAFAVSLVDVSSPDCSADLMSGVLWAEVSGEVAGVAGPVSSPPDLSSEPSIATISIVSDSGVSFG